ncbi:hypothetical protein [Vibrio parahaemolyticus]
MNTTALKTTTLPKEQQPIDLQTVETINMQLVELKNEVMLLKEQVKTDNIELEKTVSTLEVKVQSTIDFTDDLVGITGNLLSSAEDKMDTTIAAANNVLAQADTLVGTYLVWGSIVIAVISIVITAYLANKREDHVSKAVTDITDKIKTNRDFGADVIASVVGDPSFKENVATSIEKTVREQVILAIKNKSIDIEDIKRSIQSDKGGSDE